MPPENGAGLVTSAPALVHLHGAESLVGQSIISPAIPSAVMVFRRPQSHLDSWDASPIARIAEPSFVERRSTFFACVAMRRTTSEHVIVRMSIPLGARGVEVS